MIFHDYFNNWPKAKCDKIFGQWRKWVMTQLMPFYLWLYKVLFCNFRRLITWRSQLGPPIQVLYRVTLFIRIYIHYRDERRDMDRLTYITPRIKNRNFDTIFPFRKWFCSKLNLTINFINTYWKSQLKSM